MGGIQVPIGSPSRMRPITSRLDAAATTDPMPAAAAIPAASTLLRIPPDPIPLPGPEARTATGSRSSETRTASGRRGSRS